MMNIGHLIREVFNYDFARCRSASDLTENFFEKTLTIADLAVVHEQVCAARTELGGRTIDACVLLGPSSPELPVALIAQLHGNEPAGLAGILMAMALSEARMLTRPVLAVIGNPLASTQYFSAYRDAPRARQELRDAYRCGLGDGGVLLPDLNRIPEDFLTRSPEHSHTRRAQELYHIGQHISGVLDIHSARGTMLCVTDHRRDLELKNSPIRSVLVGLAEAISAHSSGGGPKLSTLKTIFSALPNVQHQVGIEAGRHESADAPLFAAMFTQSFLHAIGASTAMPYVAKKETGQFDCYHVRPRWTYGDLTVEGDIHQDDKIFMVKACRHVDALPPRADRVILRQPDGALHVQTIMQFMVHPAGELAYATYQYDEMEFIAKDTVVAVAVPGGATLHMPEDAAGIFFSKSAALYDKDPSVGPWPVAAAKRHEVKFCYPCSVKKQKLSV